MASRPHTGLNYAADALARHVQALAERQKKSGNGELSAPDLASLVRAAEVLRAIEYDRANLIVKTTGRRLATMPIEDLERLIDHVVTGEIPDDGEHTN